MSDADLQTLLFDYALGALPEDEARKVEARLAAEPELVAQLAAVEDALAASAWAHESARPDPSLREKLLAAASSPAGAWARYAEPIARFVDIAVDQARRLLEKAASPPAWEKSASLPGMELFHLTPGPRFAGADAGLVRFEPNVPFPRHNHVGDEHTLMLEGGVVLDDGRKFVAGEELHLSAGTGHAFTVMPEGCLYALVLDGGIEIPGIGIYTPKGLKPAK